MDAKKRLEESAPISWTQVALVGGGVTLAALHVVAFPFVAPAFRRYCLPYVAANENQLELLTAACRARKIRRIVDLGSGDGVVCIELARRLGLESRGVERNPWLVWYSRFAARSKGLSHLCRFHQGDLFKASLDDVDAVALFCVPAMMPDLERKLEEELSEGSFVFAARFPLATWTPVDHITAKTVSSGYNVNQLWVYQKKSHHFPPTTRSGDKRRRGLTELCSPGLWLPHLLSRKKLEERHIHTVKIRVHVRIQLGSSLDFLPQGTQR